jgi:hypothetical protein
MRNQGKEKEERGYLCLHDLLFLEMEIDNDKMR